MNQIIHLRNGSLIPREYWNQNYKTYTFQLIWETYLYETKQWVQSMVIIPTVFVSYNNFVTFNDTINFINEDLKNYNNTITFIYSEGNMSFATIRKIRCQDYNIT